ncbi:MAG: redox-regulated ATPase YchF [Deltaproteobacteria bacterium]|nr:redox-regulated ATPase YchF [Deltaproteobacteria bacterium]
MGFACGIVGLPNVGKSTIFNALTSAGAQAANYPFCTIDPNVGIVPVRDERLYKLAELIKPEKIVPTTVEFLDIAGLVKGASKGEGLGNQFLGHIRSVDAIAHIVRCFEDADVVHVAGHVDPKRDIEIIDTELILADLDSVEKRMEKTARLAKAGDKNAMAAMDACAIFKQTLENGKPIRSIELNDAMKEMLKELNLLTAKPVLFVANVDEKDLKGESPFVAKVRETAEKEQAKVVVMCGRIEAEIAELPEGERADFLKGIGLKESGLDRLAKEGYELLNLITYFTAGKKEARAWTVAKDTKAPQAAGAIHSDFEKGFIRAEVISYNDFITSGSELAAKEKGLMRLEGKDYIVKDGDIIHFRFAV